MKSNLHDQEHPESQEQEPAIAEGKGQLYHMKNRNNILEENDKKLLQHSTRATKRIFQQRIYPVSKNYKDLD